MFKKRLLAPLLLCLVAGLSAHVVYAALTDSRVIQTAQEARDISTDIVTLHTRAKAFLSYNSSQSIDWGNLPNGEDGIDADGNVEGEDFSKGEVSNAIGSIQEFVDLCDNGTLTQANHLGNLHKLASP
jgi:hypothetical protein